MAPWEYLLFYKFFWLIVKKVALIIKFTSKQEFLAIVSLGWVCGILPTLVLNTSGVALSRYIGPKWRHLFFILFLISTTVYCWFPEVRTTLFLLILICTTSTIWILYVLRFKLWVLKVLLSILQNEMWSYDKM